MCHVHELASQIADTAQRIGNRMKLKVHCAIGGEPVKNDIAKLQEGVHFLVGTPGRILDLIMRGAFDRSAIQWVILDEADHMLEDLFYTQVIKILETGFPASTKTAFFSATFPPHVIEVAEKILQNPVRILIPPNQVRLNQIQQFFVDLEREEFKFDCLCDLYKNLSIQQTVIFCNKKQKAEWIAERMTASGLHVTCIHGDLEKPERRKRLEDFRAGKSRVMVATDIISRGIDVQQLSLVINYELPPKSESYIHRIGRAGRYGRVGTTINLLMPDEYKMMESICEYYNLQVNALPNDLSVIKAML
jgi:translation initiation factor 4A